ncbi:MAG: L,D-transpeptidase family protein [Aggregatilineales bacterium]
MDGTDNRRNKRKINARERQIARQRRRMATRMAEPNESGNTSPFSSLTRRDSPVRNLLDRGGLIMGDAWWYIRHNPQIMRGAGIFVFVVLGIYFISFVFSGKIFPNVSAMGVGLGGKSVDDATLALQTAWTEDIAIDLYIDGELVQSARPSQLGLTLDAENTAKSARSVGLAGIPFGFSVDPTLELDYLSAQTFLLDLTDDVNMPAFDAGYEWRNGEVVGVDGRNGLVLDVSLTLEWLMQNADQVASSRRLDLNVDEILPNVTDPEPYLSQVRSQVNDQFRLVGYDPFRNSEVTWPISPEIYTRWLQAGISSLTLREEAFLPYVDQLNAALNTDGNDLYYIAADEAMDFLRDAITQNQSSVFLRVRYRSTIYEVQRGDTAMAIARRNGIPFFMLEEVNSGRDLDILSPGDTLQIPSRDVTMPNPPIVSKRIVVDLNEQHLVAFENGERVFEWDISSGVANAVTSPGVYQILDHDPVALGSSNTLCNSAGLECGVWEMNWFMGIYEVSPGLVNGFHGAVLLPNGNLLGGGTVGNPATFGCVMSQDENARLLYEWADVGTVVEIVSNEHLPMSDLGWSVWEANF